MADAELTSLAELGMQEDSPEPFARARERLLQQVRERWAERIHWDGPALEDLEWVCRLEAAGHVGAARMLGRELFHRPGKTTEAGRLEALGRRFPLVARFLAERELADEPDSARLIAWLELGGPAHAELAIAARELFPSGRKIRPREAALLLRHVKDARARPDANAQLRAAWLLWRVGRGPHPRAIEIALAQVRAGASLYACDEDECALMAMAIDHGGAGAPPDPLGAVHWYARALGVPPAPLASAPGPTFCYGVGTALAGRLQAPALARQWLERGLEQGSAACLQRWVALCASASPGKMPEAEAAQARVERFIAAHGRTGLGAGEGQSTAAAIIRRFDSYLAEGPGFDAARALAWTRLGVALGYRSAQHQMGELLEKGIGIERDPAAARGWYEKAAAQGYEPSRKVLGVATPAAASAPRSPSPDQEMHTRLDLARAYLEMGDYEGARVLLDEAVAEGSAEHKARAREIIESTEWP